MTRKWPPLRRVGYNKYMDIFERFNSKFGKWYEGLFGGGTSLDTARVLRIVGLQSAVNMIRRRQGWEGQGNGAGVSH